MSPSIPRPTNNHVLAELERLFGEGLTATAEELLPILRKAKKAPKGDSLAVLRYLLALHRDKFEKVPGKLGCYRKFSNKT